MMSITWSIHCTLKLVASFICFISHDNQFLMEKCLPFIVFEENIIDIGSLFIPKLSLDS